MGDAPTTSAWSTILLPIKVQIILEVWQFILLPCAHCALVIIDSTHDIVYEEWHWQMLG